MKVLLEMADPKIKADHNQGVIIGSVDSINGAVVGTSTLTRSLREQGRVTHHTNRSKGGSTGLLAQEFSRVFWNANSAILAAREAGLQPQDIPRFETPRSFWMLIIDAVESGAISGGVRGLVASAVRQFPHNEIFLQYLGSA